MQISKHTFWSSLAMVSMISLMGCVGAQASDTSGGTASAGADAGFKPSVEGKKLLHYQSPSLDWIEANPDKLNSIAIDGFIIGGFRPFYINEKKVDWDAWIERTKKVNFGRYTDNFYLCYSGVEAVEKTDFDWFDDFSWICNNWRDMARAAKEAGFKGICFDSEQYGSGKPLFGYERQEQASTKTYEEYQAQARLRGAEIMRAVNEVYPDITIIFLFGFSGSVVGVPQHPEANAKSYNLVSAFVDGLLSECGPKATIHDMHEQSFAFRVPGSYERSRRMMKDLALEYSAVPEKYKTHHKAGFSIWVDAWENSSEGRAFNVDDFETNYYTPEELAYTINQALAWSDKYIWMWPGVFRWWEGNLKTVDKDGREIKVPIPQEYIKALETAHEPHVPAPSLDRKPNTYRNEKASTWKNWSDEGAFGDLWADYADLGDLPVTWKFTTDPEEKGVAAGFYQSEFNDGGWGSIQIKEFWENQGHSPYDGQAWYRVNYTPPAIPNNDGLYLAFGAIADEATVYVNGKEVYASRVGRNMRHKRILADVTGVLKPGEENVIAVRVWNVSWCGGIWKNVKLVAKK